MLLAEILLLFKGLLDLSCVAVQTLPHLPVRSATLLAPILIPTHVTLLPAGYSAQSLFLIGKLSFDA